jgi:hypothetical protein
VARDGNFTAPAPNLATTRVFARSITIVFHGVG